MSTVRIRLDGPNFAGKLWTETMLSGKGRGATISQRRRRKRTEQLSAITGKAWRSVTIAADLSGLRGQWNVVESSLELTESGVQVQLVPANPLRWAICFSNTFIGITPFTGGFLTTVEGSDNGPLNMATFYNLAWMNYRNNGAVVQSAWYVTPFFEDSPPYSIVYSVLEVLAVPQREEE